MAQISKPDAASRNLQADRMSGLASVCVMADLGAPDPYRCAIRTGNHLEQDSVRGATGLWSCVISLRASAEPAGREHDSRYQPIGYRPDRDEF
jgi:hypothetical protein